jgi:tRNA(Ile)-lysidine synthase
VVLARPLLDVAKSRLVATLEKAGVAFADDPTNRDPAFTRPRLRALMPLLAAEGGDARSLARLAARLARANAAVEALADGAERFLALTDARQAGGASSGSNPEGDSYDAAAFAAMPEEIRLRLLIRAVNRVGHEGPAELGKVEALLAKLDRIFAEKRGRGSRRPAQIGLKLTLAGALVTLDKGRIRIASAPPRRRLDR